MLECNYNDKNVFSSLIISNTVEGGNDAFLERQTPLRDVSFILSATLPIYTGCRSVCTAQPSSERHGSRAFDIGVELERAVTTTISARLRDDGIRPVIYPTHSDPQSRARARATPGVSLLPASLPRAPPSLSYSFPFTGTCSTLDLATDVTIMLFAYGLSAYKHRFVE